MEVGESTMAYKTYTELVSLPTFEERFKYLQLNGAVAEETFGFDRYLNQALYRSKEWKCIRDIVIIRDNGCDLGIEGREILDHVIIHHMNPISMKDIIEGNPKIYDPEYLITTTHRTHNAIHYGDESLLFTGLVTRTQGDTTPWRIK